MQQTADQMVADGTPGVIILTRRGHEVSDVVAGLADTVTGQPMRAQDRVHIASITNGLGIYIVHLSCGIAWGHDGGYPGGFKTIAYTSRDGSRQTVMVYNNYLISANPTPSF